MNEIYYTLDEMQDQRKKEFIALRMERELFILLKQKAMQENLDLSHMIRSLCREGLEKK